MYRATGERCSAGRTVVFASKVIWRLRPQERGQWAESKSNMRDTLSPRTPRHFPPHYHCPIDNIPIYSYTYYPTYCIVPTTLIILHQCLPNASQKNAISLLIDSFSNQFPTYSTRTCRISSSFLLMVLQRCVSFSSSQRLNFLDTLTVE